MVSGERVSGDGEVPASQPACHVGRQLIIQCSVQCVPSVQCVVRTVQSVQGNFAKPRPHKV